MKGQLSSFSSKISSENIRNNCICRIQQLSNLEYFCPRYTPFEQIKNEWGDPHILKVREVSWLMRYSQSCFQSIGSTVSKNGTYTVQLISKMVSFEPSTALPCTCPMWNATVNNAISYLQTNPVHGEKGKAYWKLKRSLFGVLFFLTLQGTNSCTCSGAIRV